MVKYRFIDDPQETKPVAKFKYVGSEEFGTAKEVTFYGCQFKLGEVTEVADEYAADKIRTHFDEAFEEEDGEDAPKKRGRPRKTDEEREADRIEREAEKARREQEREAGKSEEAQPAGAVQTDLAPEDDWDDPEQP